MAHTELPNRLLILLFLYIFFITVGSETTIRKCFKGTDEQRTGEADFSCPDGYVITVSKALLGRNKWFECDVTDDDCVQMTSIFKDCEGSNSCNKTFNTYSARCGYSTLLLIKYDCVQDTVPQIPTQISTDKSSVSIDNDDVNVGITHGDDIGEGNEEKRNKEEQDPYNKRVKKGGKDDEEQDASLLAVTILASIITGVMLVIAIVMTIRRLLNYPMRMQRREGDNPSRFVDCLERACFHVDKLPCFSGPPDSQGSSQLALRTTRKSNGTALSMDETVQNTQRTRMTPIGQEASDVTDINQSKSDLDRVLDPEGSDISEQAQTPSTMEAVVARSSFKVKQIPSVNVNLNNTNKRYSDKTGGLNYSKNDSVILKIHNINNNQTKNNNNNTNVKNVPSISNDGSVLIQCDPHKNMNTRNSNINWSDLPLQTYKGQDVTVNNNNNNDVIINNNDVNINNCNGSDSGYDTLLKPKYTAIVVPNTESSSRC